MAFTKDPANWREGVRPSELEHWERVWEWHQDLERQAEADGVTYRYIPWYEARGDRSLIGKRVSMAYWVRGGETPWGHQHAHMYRHAFEPLVNIGADFIALQTRGSETLISYDTICVQEPTA